jgi:hypothetical protein
VSGPTKAMPDEFQCDGFLSHHHADKPRVRKRRSKQNLFIDACKLPTLINRVHREFTDANSPSS